jgi:hypothetical protein
MRETRVTERVCVEDRRKLLQAVIEAACKAFSASLEYHEHQYGRLDGLKAYIFSNKSDHNRLQDAIEDIRPESVSQIVFKESPDDSVFVRLMVADEEENTWD